jgi:hypothetical protein
MTIKANWRAIIVCYKTSILMQIFTPTTIYIDEVKRRIIVKKRANNLFAINTKTIWIKDIKSFEIINLLGGCNIHIKSRGNNITCRGFLKRDADILKQFLDKFR